MKRQPLARRTPSGRIVRDAHLLAPAVVKRMVDAAAASARDPLFGSQLGRLHLNGKLTSSQLAAGKHWAELTSDYSAACRSPPAPRTLSIDTPGGTPIDPDSERGEKEVAYHEQITAAYLEGRHALRLAGRDAERVADEVCTQDRAPAGLSELNALRAGLAALAALWSAKRKASAR
jgi:hypothetical protein